MPELTARLTTLGAIKSRRSEGLGTSRTGDACGVAGSKIYLHAGMAWCGSSSVVVIEVLKLLLE